jgi:hypothetical protein
MFSAGLNGSAEFKGGKEDRAGAAGVAGNCRHFQTDVEEELVADEMVSCYNCRYRRWTTGSFTCMKRGK